MFFSQIMFLAPETASLQATPTSPPAVAIPARRDPARGDVTWKFAAGVAGNAVGFAALMAGCWMVLQLLQALL